MKIVSMFRKRRVATVAVAVAALLLTAAGVATAAVTTKSGTSVTRVSVLTQGTAAVYTGAAWVTIGTTSLYATAGSFVVATFTAESACYGGSGWCSVRVLVDGGEAEPVAGTDFAFNSTDNGTESASSWESHSVQRTRSVAVSAYHAVAVQVTQVGAGVAHRVDDWALSAIAVTP